MTATASNLSQKYRRRWWTLAVLSLSLLLVELDSTILNVALPTLQREFDASASALQWLVDSYILVFAGLLLFMGALGDRFGRKRALLAGFLLLGLASLAASLAGSMNQLIVARLVMGVGAALIMPATLAIIVDIFPREERVKAIAIWSAVAVLGIPVGPVLGGWLLSQFWWGSVFLVAVPIAVVAVIAAVLLVPESKNPATSALDRIGALLSVGALTSLVYAVIEAPARGVLDVWVIAASLAAVAFGAAFVVRELRVDEPLLDVRLLKDRNISVGAGSIMLVFGSFVGMLFLLTQFLQLAQGYSAFESGLRVTPLALGFVVGAAGHDRPARGAPRDSGGDGQWSLGRRRGVRRYVVHGRGNAVSGARSAPGVARHWPGQPDGAREGRGDQLRARRQRRRWLGAQRHGPNRLGRRSGLRHWVRSRMPSTRGACPGSYRFPPSSPPSHRTPSAAPPSLPLRSVVPRGRRCVSLPAQHSSTPSG